MEALQEPEIPQISSGALSSSEKVQLRSKGRLSSGERLMILPNLARVCEYDTSSELALADVLNQF